VLFLDSSVLVTVPSGDWVTVFSFVLTLPSLLVLLLSLWDTSRSHPASSNDDTKAHVATHTTTAQRLILCFIGGKIGDGWTFYYGAFPPRLIG